MKRLFAIFLVLASTFAAAQTPRFSLSTHSTTIETYDRIVGFGGTFSYSFARHFALDSVVNFFPGNPQSNLGEHTGFFAPYWRSGNILQGQFGLRGSILESSKADVFLSARPGFVSFSNLSYHSDSVGLGCIGLTTPCVVTASLGRQTYFAPSFGGGAIFYPSSKFFVRIDGDATVIRYSGFSPTFYANGVAMSSPTPSYYSSPRTNYTFQFSTGVGFRFGGRR